MSDSNTLDSSPIVVDCIDGIMQELGNLRTVLNTKPNERKDAQSGVQLVFSRHHYTFLRNKKLIEVGNEIGEQMEEGIIEIGIEVFYLLRLHVGGFCQSIQFLIFTPLNHTVDTLTKIINLVNIVGTEAHEASYIHLLNPCLLVELADKGLQLAVGVVERKIGLEEFVVKSLRLSILFAQLIMRLDSTYCPVDEQRKANRERVRHKCDLLPLFSARRMAS